MLGLKGALLSGALVDILLGIYLLRRPRGELAFSWPGFATVIAGLAAFGIVAAGVRMDPLRMAAGVYRDGTARLSPDTKIRYYGDGKTATVSVIEWNGRMLLRTNGKTDASVSLQGPPTDDEPTQVLLGALAIGANPQAKRVAVIGMGSGITSATLLSTPTLQRVDTIEIERRMADGAKQFGERNAGLWTDERSHFVFDDAKAWLARSSAPWDIIVSEPSNPWVSGVASLFTTETYERIAKHLAPGGVLVQWIQIYEVDGALLSSIFRALVAHFPHYAVYKSGPGDLIIVASRDRVPVVDATALFKHRELGSMLRKVGVAGPADIDARWRGDSHVFNALLAAFDAPVNSDYQPYVDLNAARMRFVQADFRPMFEASVGPHPMLEVLGAVVPRTAGSESALGLALAAALAARAGDARHASARARELWRRGAGFARAPAYLQARRTDPGAARRRCRHGDGHQRAALRSRRRRVDRGAAGRVLSLARSEPAALGRPVRGHRRPRCSDHVRARHARRRVGADRLRAQLRVERCRRRGHRAQATGGRGTSARAVCAVTAKPVDDLPAGSDRRQDDRSAAQIVDVNPPLRCRRASVVAHGSGRPGSCRPDNRGARR